MAWSFMPRCNHHLTIFFKWIPLPKKKVTPLDVFSLPAFLDGNFLNRDENF